MGPVEWLASEKADTMFERLLEGVQEGTALFLGLLCVAVFAANAVLLFVLLMKKGTHGLARCPKCGRVIACPHCEEDEEFPNQR